MMGGARGLAGAVRTIRKTLRAPTSPGKCPYGISARNDAERASAILRRLPKRFHIRPRLAGTRSGLIRNRPIYKAFTHGASRDRTGDLLLAKQAPSVQRAESVVNQETETSISAGVCGAFDDQSDDQSELMTS